MKVCTYCYSSTIHADDCPEFKPKKMPKQKPGTSKQDYGTPQVFLDAVKKRLNIEAFALDAAADQANTVAEEYYDIIMDSLKQSWVRPGWTWCNPPYAHIVKWVSKACEEASKGANIAMLIPASVGANWWAKYVHDKCHVVLLNGRITFNGQTAPFPKDCALLLYTPHTTSGYTVWKWM